MAANAVVVIADETYVLPNVAVNAIGSEEDRSTRRCGSAEQLDADSPTPECVTARPVFRSGSWH